MASMQMAGLAGWAAAAWRRTCEKAQARELELIETVSLGGRKQVSLVVCGGQRFLVGCGSDSVTSIIALREDDPSATKQPWGAGF